MSRSSKPVSYSCHVTPSTPGAALRLKRVEAVTEQINTQMVEQGSKPFLLSFLCCFSHTVQSLGHAFPALCQVHVWLSDVLLPSVPFPPQPPQKVLLLCSAGSQVLRHSPTSPTRARPHCGLWPSRAGLGCHTKACWRSPGSRACCFVSVPGFFDYAGPDSHSRITQLPCCLPLLRNAVGILIYPLFEAQYPAHRCLCLRFNRHLTMSPARLEARMDSLFPFL